MQGVFYKIASMGGSGSACGSWAVFLLFGFWGWIGGFNEAREKVASMGW